jgi:hypothetical protein
MTGRGSLGITSNSISRGGWEKGVWKSFNFINFLRGAYLRMQTY